ncbi:MAG: AmmeMemoRadiSam system radical SAM enzyme [Bacteroidales bacterium]|nr:AmmeMemoRadiSam system radical SAM enzyme [Bacteroidales bacterium]
MMKEASFYERLNGKVKCFLCPHECLINDGKRGSCRVRKNIKGRLISENYQQICSYNFDPIEKKPLYHFFPGQTIFSIGSIGCNLHCSFCQNWEISQSGIDEHPYLKSNSPEDIVNQAKNRSDNLGIAFTYNEPTVWYEYMIDIAKLAKDKGLKTVMVTNGFINPEPLEELLPYMDAFSVDLKAFTEQFYKQQTSSKLAPVLETIQLLKKHNKHFEITNLVITDTNDNEKDFSEMVNWIVNETGEDTVLHISRYFPMYKMTKEATSVDKLMKLYTIAKEKLNYVYLGNVRSGEGQDTFCKSCNSRVISRSGYYTESDGLNSIGNCNNCKQPIITY